MVMAMWACWIGMSGSAAAQSADDEASGQVINLAFEGGSAMDYVEAVRAASADANIVVESPELLAKVDLPPVRLKSVAVDAALRILEDRQDRTEDNWPVRMKVVSTIGNAYIRGGSRPAGEPLHEIKVEAKVPLGGEAQITGVWTLTDILEHDLQADHVLAAIETALDLVSEGLASASVRFHEPTKLLIARGRGAQIEAIEQVIDRIRESMELQSSTTGDELTQCLNAVEKFEMARERMAADLQRTQAEYAKTIAEHETTIATLENTVRQLQEMVEEMRQTAR